MDLSNLRFDRDVSPAALPSGLAVLLASAAGRQAASVTARSQARLKVSVATVAFAPAHGAFNPSVAALLTQEPRE